MIKAASSLVLLTTLSSAFFMPTFSFGGGDSDNVDKNFERDDRTKIVLDKKHSKIYYDSTPSPKMSFEEAQTFCKNIDYLGYKEWRVPTKEEYISILELSRRNMTVKHAFKNVQSDIYWSSTPDRFNEAWYFDFDLGRYSTHKRNNKHYTLCVLNL